MSIPMNPIQPLIVDDVGTVRFKENKIVRHLLDHGGIGMSALGYMTFTDDDRVQFAQLIGYSLGGFAELSYVSDEAYEAARTMHESGTSEIEARSMYLRSALQKAREDLREPIAALYGIHPDDLLLLELDK